LSDENRCVGGRTRCLRHFDGCKCEIKSGNPPLKILRVFKESCRMDDKAETLANFMAIANASDEATAISTLEATDWVLDDAVNLFFASGEAQGTSERARSARCANSA